MFIFIYYTNKIVSDADDSANNKTGCNNKKFFGYIKSLHDDHCGIFCLKRNGVAYSDSQSKAEVLNDHFSSVFTAEDTLPEDICLDSNQFPDISDSSVHTGGVAKILRELNEQKASGPDELTARLLQEVANEIAPVLALLFQASLHQGRPPADWNHALVNAVFKKGDRTQASNYRPISLSSGSSV